MTHRWWRSISEGDMASLEIEKINVFYGQLHVIRDASFQVSRGELVCIFGSNGHGKSTLLKAICGLVKTRSGKMIYDGADITNHKVTEVVKKGIVYIPEDRNLFNGMTVLENLKLGAYLPKARPKEEENLRLIFNLFPRLQERKKQTVSTLSGGELRMLAVGRGLMTDADCLLIDEPSIGLSPLLKTEMYNVIKKIKEEKRPTIVLVEQDFKEAKWLADRVYLLKHGEFVFTGQREALDEETVRRAFL
jgi:branched-chain amino acid transport system ATP-binding protein